MTSIGDSIKLWLLPLLFALVIIGGSALLSSLHAQQHGSSTQSAFGIGCNNAVVYDALLGGSTQLVAGGTNGEAIYICGYTILATGTVAIELDAGTGINCATGTKKLTPTYEFTSQTNVTDSSPLFRGLFAPSGNALCLRTSAVISAQAVVYYAQF